MTRPTMMAIRLLPTHLLFLCLALCCCSILSLSTHASAAQHAFSGLDDLQSSHHQRLAELRQQAEATRQHSARSSLPIFSSSPSFTATPPASSFPAHPFAPSAAPSLVISPLSYGADPFGQLDSTAALQSAVAALFTLPLSHSPPHYLSDRVIDLGGVILSLDGGSYLISSPLIFPAGFGNYHITSGTLRAASNFTSPSSHLIHIGNSSTDDVFTDCGQCSWAQNVHITSLLLDANHVAAGGVWISGVMGAVLRQLYVIGFLTSGVEIVGGHEVQVVESWFGVRLWSQSAPLLSADPITTNSTAAVRIIGFDHDLTSIIIFSAPIGVYVRGACNLLQNIHTWNGSPYGVFFDGDIPDSASAGSNRLLASYMDFSNVVLTNPYQVVIANTFFLGGGHIVLRSSSTAGNPRAVRGLTVSNCQWNGPYKAPSVELDESESTFVTVEDVVMTGNQYVKGQYVAMGTRARVVEEVVASGLWCVDLSGVLVFPQLEVQWSALTWKVTGGGKDGRWVLVDELPSSLPKGDQRGVCLTAIPATNWSSTIYLEVDQSTRSQWGAL